MPEIALIPLGAEHPEDVLVLPDGDLLTGVASGHLLRVGPDGSVRPVAETHGMPLGLELLPDGRILVCDSHRGILAVDLVTGSVEALIAAPPAFCNNPAVAPDGTIWFSTSSKRHGLSRSTRDILENIPTGCLMRRDPDGGVDVALDGLAFANGVAVTPDAQAVLVAETGAGRIQRLWIDGPKAGQNDLFVQDLPGLPDNLSVDDQGRIWVALVARNGPDLARLHAAPVMVRKTIAALPGFLRPRGKPFLRVAAFDAAGTVIHDFEGSAERFHTVTGVRVSEGQVYLGTIAGSSLARFTLPVDK